MEKIGKLLILVWIYFACAQFAWAGASVEMKVNRDRVGVGQTIVATVTILSTESVSATAPRPPDFSGFQMVNNWQTTSVSQKLVQTSSGMDFQTQRREEFHYELQATKPGRFSIGSFEVSVDGKTQTTQSVVVTVTNQQQSPAPSQQEEDEGFPGMKALEDMERAEEDMFSQLLQRRQQQFMGRPDPQFKNVPVNKNEAFFIQAEVDKTEVYEGEQVTVAWYILTRGQMESLDRAKFPDLRGFWKEVIEEVPTIQFSEEIINGIPYHKALLAAHALFPIKPGTSYIDEYKIKAKVRLPQDSGGRFGLGQAYEYTKSSPRIAIKVKPLPLDGRPANFTGAVGQFNVTAQVDSVSVPAHQPFILRLRIEGEGNAKGIELPAIPWPQGLELYDTKSESKYFKNGRSYKSFDIYLIPRQEGDLTLPSVELAVFDPKKGVYEQKRSEPITIKVIPGDGKPVALPGGSATVADKSPSKVSNGPSLPSPLQEYGQTLPHWPFLGSVVFWVFTFFGIFALLVVKARLELSTGHRRRDLGVIIKNKLKVIDQKLTAQDSRAVGVEIGNLLQLVLGEATGETGASEQFSKVMDRLPPSLRKELGEAFATSVEYFQILGYAPEEVSKEMREISRVQKNLKEMKKMIQQIVARLGDGNRE